MAQLVFSAGISLHGQIFNAAIKLVERKGWPQLVPLVQVSDAELQQEVDEACADVNAFLAKGFTLAILAIAARTCANNHAEIIKCAAEAVAGQHASLRSFA